VKARNTDASGRAPLGIFGGTFDPIHHGHLRTALEVLERCQLASVRLMLCGQPVHRAAPHAPAALRFDMLQAAVAGESRLVPDGRELRRAGPSYTVDSLLELRAELGSVPLCLILGADAFAALESWHRWREIIDLAHLIVVHRPGSPIALQGALAQFMAGRRDDDPAALRRVGPGVLRLQAVTALDISSSAIRQRVAGGGDPRYLLPDAVRELIMRTGCYRQPAKPQEAEKSA
jgi:nicotinate-nucleotide adenylyltransferase